jgi:hypothetical protein
METVGLVNTLTALPLLRSSRHLNLYIPAHDFEEVAEEYHRAGTSAAAPPHYFSIHFPPLPITMGAAHPSGIFPTGVLR